MEKIESNGGAVLSSMEPTVNDNTDLTDVQKARIERNRQHALLLRQSKEAKKLSNLTRQEAPHKKVVDTGGGFMLDDDDQTVETQHKPLVHLPAPILFGDQLFCVECNKEMLDSYLHKNFDLAVCDNCRNDLEEYDLITKTDARNEYLLKDCDFLRDPPLKFIQKRNPRNDRWGEMKLYVKKQVEARAFDVHGGEEGLTEEHNKRKEKRDLGKQKKFDKKMKELRMSVRSSLYKKDSSTHEHEYGAEKYDEEEDVYIKTCGICGHHLSYEKM